MDIITRSISSDLGDSPEVLIATLLKGTPENRHLDILTELLTQSSGVDERVASFITAAWNWVCQNDLWSVRYESLGDYREAIGYTETVQPIVRRHKKSELAKQSSSQTIFRCWKVPFGKAFSEDIRPVIWSKHLLSLMACLSRHRSHSESIILIQESMKTRPDRGRNRSRIMASDVQRVLDKIYTQQKRSKIPGRDQIDLVLINSETADDSDEVKKMHGSGEAPVPTTQSCQGQRHTAVTNLQQLKFQKDLRKRQCCECIPICLPLTTLISTPGLKFDDGLLMALIDWARTVSWGSFCSDHLELLALFLPMDYMQFRNRREVIQNLDNFRLRGCRKSIGDHTTVSPLVTCENTELLCRYTGSADAWWRWKRDGFLHLPGFFSYMEELGVFQRVRKYLLTKDTEGDHNSARHITCGMLDRCYSMLSEMAQSDPGYYAILVACRPDQNMRLIHCLEKTGKRDIFESDDLSFGVTMDRVKPLVKGEGISDIQSTIVFPTLERIQRARLVPGFHRQLNSWFQSSLDLKHRREYSRFGQAKDIAVQPGDLVICLPQILRFPKSFSSPNLFNLSQVEFDNESLTTLERPLVMAKSNTPGNPWEQLKQQPAMSDREVYHNDWKDVGPSDYSPDRGIAIADALKGRLDWNCRKVIEESACLFETDGLAAVDFVRKSRAHLADQFHRTLDSMEEGLQEDADSGIEGREIAPHLAHAQNSCSDTLGPIFEDLLSQIPPMWDGSSLNDAALDLELMVPELPI